MYVSRRFYRSEGTLAISYFLAPRQYFPILEAGKIVRGHAASALWVGSTGQPVRVANAARKGRDQYSNLGEPCSNATHTGFVTLLTIHMTIQTTVRPGSLLPKTMISRPFHSFT